MILMLNQHTVVFEVLNAIRIRAAQQLQLPDAWVQIRLEKDEHLLGFGKSTFHPVIDLLLPSKDSPTSAPLYEDCVRNGLRAFRLSPVALKIELKTLVELAKNEIDIRLAGLDA